VRALSNAKGRCRYVSPRTRAQRTLELLDLGCRDNYPWKQEEGAQSLNPKTNASIQITPAIREWDYGAYEGLTSKQIHASSPDWDIWTHGCPGGESPAEITERLDAFISEIRTKWHKGKFGGKEPMDVLVVAHGHILRAMAARWVGKSVEGNPGLILEAGGVGTLRYVFSRFSLGLIWLWKAWRGFDEEGMLMCDHSYEHNSIDEPAILLGGAFVVDVVEKEEEERKE
jgi:broad specificity phosphatase PhoE